MRFLLINTNRERSPQTVIPLGTCCVASAARAAGHAVDVLDLCFERDPVAVTERVVRWVRPDAVGLSVRNLDNADLAHPQSYVREAQALADACRRTSDAPLILGGAAVGLLPEAFARTLGCRWAISGEGESAVPALLGALARGEAPSGIPGLTTVEGETAQSEPACLQPELAELPDPEMERWLELRQYRAQDAAYPVQTKRGCALTCSYCVYPRLEGRQWRLRDPDWVAEQARLGGVAHFRLVEFVDSVFGMPEDHAIACCMAISRLPEHPPLTTMDLNPSACSPALVEAMNAAGFTAVAISAESGSDTMLERFGKGYSVATLHRARETLRGLHAQRLWIFLLGAPGECEETVRDTARFIGTLPHEDLVFVAYGVRLLPGTKLHAQAVCAGEVAPDDPLLWPTFVPTPLMTAERAAALLAESGFPADHMVTVHDGGGRWIPLAQRVMARCGLPPPYWRYAPGMNRVRALLRFEGGWR
ncbi:MAG TPA: cobalamin-dependent protein [Armatimonadota bacterium]